MEDAVEALCVHIAEAFGAVANERTAKSCGLPAVGWPAAGPVRTLRMFEGDGKIQLLASVQNGKTTRASLAHG